jgi:hypothetical protein
MSDTPTPEAEVADFAPKMAEQAIIYNNCLVINTTPFPWHIAEQIEIIPNDNGMNLVRLIVQVDGPVTVDTNYALREDGTKRRRTRDDE